MDRRRFIAVAGLAGLAGCARLRSSRLNPINWFGRGRSVPALTPDIVAAADPRPLVDNVTALHVERTPGGGIVRATGLPGRQGWFGAHLVPAASEDDAVRLYQLRAFPPAGATPVSTEASRELVVATFMTDQELAGIREIRVSGARNTLSSRR